MQKLVNLGKKGIKARELANKEPKLSEEFKKDLIKVKKRRLNWGIVIF